MKPTRHLDWLNYHHLRYFWAVAREGSLRQAAAKLNVSEPAISAQLQELASALGEPLFRKSGRSLVLTETGHMVLGYADEIFELGQELLNAVRQMPTNRALRVNVGVVDSFPKLVTCEFLKPLFTSTPPTHVIVQEGKAEDLLPRLGSHRLDILFSDQPAPTSVKFKTYSHLLGSSTVSICATAKFARTIHGPFPQCLDGIACVLPTQNTHLRRALEDWFHQQRIHPRVVAEFEDAALMKVAAAEGIGFIPIPTRATEEAVDRYNFRILGEVRQVKESFFGITAERRVRHPAVSLITQQGETV